MCHDKQQERFKPGQTPLEIYTERKIAEYERTVKMQNELDKYGHKCAAGGLYWTGADLAKFFLDQQKKKHPRRLK